MEPENGYQYRGIRNQCAGLSFSFKLPDFLKFISASFHHHKINVQEFTVHGGAVVQIFQEKALLVNDLDIYIEIEPPENPYELQELVLKNFQMIGDFPYKSDLRKGGLKALGLYPNSLFFTFPCFVKDRPRDFDLMIAWGKQTRCFSSADCFHIDLLPYLEGSKAHVVKTVEGYPLERSLISLEQGNFYLPSIQKAKEIRQGLQIYVSRLTKGLLPETPQIERAFLEDFELEYENLGAERFYQDVIKYIHRHLQNRFMKTLFYLYNFKAVLHEKEEYLLKLNLLFEWTMSNESRKRELDRSRLSQEETQSSFDWEDKIELEPSNLVETENLPSSPILTLSGITQLLLFWHSADKSNVRRLDDFPGGSRYQIKSYEYEKDEYYQGCLFVPLPLKETLEFINLDPKIRKKLVLNISPLLKRLGLPTGEKALLEILLRRFQENLPYSPFTSLMALLNVKGSALQPFILKFLSVKNELKPEEKRALAEIFRFTHPNDSFLFDESGFVAFAEKLEPKQAEPLWAILKKSEDPEVILRYLLYLLSVPLNRENLQTFIKSDPNPENQLFKVPLKKALLAANLEEFKILLPFACKLLNDEILSISLKYRDPQLTISILEQMVKANELETAVGLETLRSLCQKKQTDKEGLLFWNFLLKWSGQTDCEGFKALKISAVWMLILDHSGSERNFVTLLLSERLKQDIGPFLEKWIRLSQFLEIPHPKEILNSDTFFTSLYDSFPPWRPWIKEEILKLLSKETLHRLKPIILRMIEDQMPLEELLSLSTKTQSLELSDPLQETLMSRFFKVFTTESTLPSSTIKACHKYYLTTCSNAMPSERAVKCLNDLPGPWGIEEGKLAKMAVEKELMTPERLWEMSKKEDWNTLIGLAIFCLNHKISTPFLEEYFTRIFSERPIPKDLNLLKSLWGLCKNFSNQGYFSTYLLEKAISLPPTKESTLFIYSFYEYPQIYKIENLLKYLTLFPIKFLGPEERKHLIGLINSLEKLSSESPETIWPAILSCLKADEPIKDLFVAAHQTLLRGTGQFFLTALEEWGQILGTKDHYTEETYFQLYTHVEEAILPTTAGEEKLKLFEWLTSIYFKNTASTPDGDWKAYHKLADLLDESLKILPLTPLSDHTRSMISFFIDQLTEQAIVPLYSPLQFQNEEIEHLFDQLSHYPDRNFSLFVRFLKILGAHKTTSVHIIQEWLVIGKKRYSWNPKALIEIASLLESSIKNQTPDQLINAIAYLITPLLTTYKQQREGNLEIKSLIIDFSPYLFAIYRKLTQIYNPSTFDANLFTFLMGHADMLRSSFRIKSGNQEFDYKKYCTEFFKICQKFRFIKYSHAIKIFSLLIECVESILEPEEAFLTEFIINFISLENDSKEGKRLAIINALSLFMSKEHNDSFPLVKTFTTFLLLKKSLLLKLIEIGDRDVSIIASNIIIRFNVLFPKSTLLEKQKISSIFSSMSAILLNPHFESTIEQKAPVPHNFFIDLDSLIESVTTIILTLSEETDPTIQDQLNKAKKTVIHFVELLEITFKKNEDRVNFEQLMRVINPFKQTLKIN